EEQAHGKARVRFDNKRTAVAALAERVAAGAFDFDLVVETEVAHAVVDDDIIQFDCGSSPVLQIGGSAQLRDLGPDVEEISTKAGKFTQALDRSQVGFDSLLQRGDGGIDAIDGRLRQLDEVRQTSDSIFRVLAAIEVSGLQDWVADGGGVFV